VFGSFSGKYLFSDYVCGKIFAFDGNNVATFATALGGSSAVDLQFGPGSQGGTSLYYTTYAGGGEIHEIRFTGNANRPPPASTPPSPTSGPTPLAVAFDGSNSSDPDQGDTLTYTWTFGDGSPSQTTSGPTTSHTYTATGNFTAKLVVKDNHGASSPAD